MKYTLSMAAVLLALIGITLYSCGDGAPIILPSLQMQLSGPTVVNTGACMAYQVTVTDPDQNPAALNPDKDVKVEIKNGTNTTIYTRSDCTNPGEYFILPKNEQQGTAYIKFANEVGDATVKAGSDADINFPITIAKFQTRQQGDWTGSGLVVSSLPANDGTGDVYVFGSVQGVDGHSSRVLRLKANGTVDQTFNVDCNAQVHDVAFMGEELVVVGNFTSCSATPVGRVAVYSKDGVIKSTGFNNNAVQPNSAVETVAVTDTHILLGGSFTDTNSVPRQGFMALTRAGDTDSTFMSNFGNSIDIYSGSLGVVDIVVQPDGKILLAGSFTLEAGSDQGGIIRLNADGTVDSTFVSTVAGFFQMPAIVTSLALDSDGNVYAGGSFASYGGQESGSFIILTSTGAIKERFDNGLLNNADSGMVRSVGVYANGSKIFLAGTFNKLDRNNGQNTAATSQNILALNGDGSLDTTFNVDGVGANGLIASSVQVLPDSSGDIMVSGWTITQYNDEDAGVLFRLTGSGQID